MATEADNLYKTQPTIDFPGLGITDRRETPIVDNKLSLTNKMRLQAASVARTAPTERRSGGRRDSVADSIRHLGRMDAEKVSTGAVGSSRVGTGAVAAAGNAAAPYAMSSGLRQEIYGAPGQAHTGPTAALSTQLHENFHLAMRRVEQKHGRRARLLAAATMIGGMPEGHQNAVRDFAEHRGYEPSHPLFNEEALALLHNYNNNPGERAAYHSAYERSPGAQTHIDRQMKEAYHGARAIAAGIKPEHVAGGEPGIMKAESESDEMCREPGADGSGAVETPAAEVSLVLATDGMGRLLMGKRQDNGLWTLPGGAANPNEPPDVTARRELGEETGLQPKSLTLIATSPPHAPGAPMLHIFSAHVTGIPHGRFDPDQECQEWQWIDVRGGIPGNIWDSLHGPDGDDNILRQIFDYKGLEKSEQIWLDAGFMDLRKAIKLTEDEAVPAVKEALTDDLRRPPYQGSPNHDEGHCYVASEALYHLMGGAAAGWTPQHIKHEGAPHWYLKHQSGRILDPTASQFQTPVPYDQGRGMGFLTAVPSARARDVMSRALGELHGGFRKSELSKATPEFDAWFAGSHIKDSSGAPKRVFHGTSKDKDFHTFKIGQRGAWFTTDPNEAGKYAADNDSQNYSYDTGSPVKTNTAARIIPAYLSLKNPHYMTADEMKAINDVAGKSQSAVGYKKPQAAFFQTLRAKGHDGVIMPDGNTFVAFQPNQIKSAYNTKPGAGGHLMKSEPSDAYKMLAHPDPRERAMAIKLGDTTPADLAVAICDPDPWVWRVAFNHPDAQHALDVLAASSRDAAGVPIYDRHDALLADPRCHDGHLQSMHTAVKDDAEMPIEIRAKRISTLMAHPLGGRLRGEPLKKHWGNRKIKQESSQLQGVVNPSEDVPMEHLGHLAHAYHQHVNGAKPLTPTDAELHETGATSPKVVYKIPVAGHKEDRRFMVKPYSEHGYPLSGWAEGTSQALYHAGQIGNLHQQSFPVSHGTGETVAPGVAIHIENAEPVSKVSFTTIAKKNPEGAEQARRIGLMDFLTGNNDRGTQNMMVRPDRSLLAIDHGQAFQYGSEGDDFSWFTERQAPMHVYAPDVAKDRLTNPHSKIGDWTSTFNWWGKNGADIRRAFNERLKIIKSPQHAEHLRRHFNARADWLDRQVGVDHAARPWNWHREYVVPAPANSAAQRLHELTKALGKRDFLFEHSDSPIEVDHDMLQKAHHISNEPKAQEFEKNLNEPAHSIAPVMGHFTGHEPKAVYEHAGHGYLVKPADVEPPRHEHDPDGDALPVAWNEMTSQGLYHAAGLGDYHNRAHFTMTNPGYRDQDVPPRPALVVHMHPDAMTWEEAKDQDSERVAKTMEPENMRAMRRIGMMDVATGNYDRHTNNIMVRPDGKPLAIDNGFSFNIDHDYGVGKHGSTDPAVVARANVLGRRDESGNMIPYTAGLGIGGQPDEADWAWWDQVKPGILSQMEHHLSMLKSRDHRDAVRHSFHTRVGMMRNLIEPTEADRALQAAEEAKFEADQVAAYSSSGTRAPSELGTDQTEPVEKPWAGEFPTDRTSYRSSNEGA